MIKYKHMINSVNVAGKYKGVQNRTLKIEDSATFTPCAAHKLNLVGVNSACTCVEIVNFFGIV